MTVREAITHATGSIDRRDAEHLLLHTLRHDRPWLHAHPEAELSSEEMECLTALVTRRARHEPLQYLLGHQEFFGLDLCVTSDVLIPRPETELLVQAVLGWAQSLADPTGLRCLDVGTGSGAIALALAAHLPTASITAVDLSPAALAVAQGNAVRLGLDQSVTFQLADLVPLHPASGTGFGSGLWDIIVSNPPYVPLVDKSQLQPEVRDFEPHMALFAGSDGLAIYHRLIPQAKAALRSGGLLALEFGFRQRNGLASLLRDWNSVEFRDDLAGIPRIALAELP